MIDTLDVKKIVCIFPHVFSLVTVATERNGPLSYIVAAGHLQFSLLRAASDHEYTALLERSSMVSGINERLELVISRRRCGK